MSCINKHETNLRLTPRFNTPCGLNVNAVCNNDNTLQIVNENCVMSFNIVSEWIVCRMSDIVFLGVLWQMLQVVSELKVAALTPLGIV